MEDPQTNPLQIYQPKWDQSKNEPAVAGMDIAAKMAAVQNSATSLHTIAQFCVMLRYTLCGFKTLALNKNGANAGRPGGR